MRTILTLFLFLSGFTANAQIDSHQHQLQLVDSVRSYIQNTLHLNIGNDFYTKWSTQKDSMYYYLYVSKPNRVESVLPTTWAFYAIEDSAIAAAHEWDKKDCQTLVYKTAGTSTAELTPKLLNYPDEVIAFIMVHEAVHRHINSMNLNPGFPYIFNECLCDAMANKTCVVMAKTLKLLNSKAVNNQKRIFEKVYAYLNSQRKKLDSVDTTIQSKIFKQTTKRIKVLVGHGNQFQKDRMIYPVNNAYFLRNQAYTIHYFEVQQMLDTRLPISNVIQNIYKRKVQH